MYHSGGAFLAHVNFIYSIEQKISTLSAYIGLDISNRKNNVEIIGTGKNYAVNISYLNILICTQKRKSVFHRIANKIQLKGFKHCLVALCLRMCVRIEWFNPYPTESAQSLMFTRILMQDIP